jgi:outer membrane protein TolC
MINTLLNNLDLKIADAQAKQGQQVARASLAKELPHVTLNPNFTRQKNSKTLTTPNLQQFSGTGPRLFAPGETVNIYTLPINVNYQLDPWLKNRYLTQSALLQAQAQQWRYHALQLQVSAATASGYLRWQRLRGESTLLAKKQELLILQERLAKDLIRSGLLASVQGSVYRQAVLACQQEQQIVLDQQSQNEKTLRLAMADASTQPMTTLLGLPSSLSQVAPTKLPPALSEQAVAKATEDIAASLQATLAHRPDVAAAETLLGSAGLNVKVAQRLFLPSFNLTGQVGLSSTTLKQWMNWDSLLASVGASAVQTLFSGGELKANLKQQKLFYEEHVARYRMTYLTALQEVAVTHQQLELAKVNYTLAQQRLHEQHQLLASRYSQVKGGTLPERELLPNLVDLLELHRYALQQHELLLQHWVSYQLACGGLG